MSTMTATSMSRLAVPYVAFAAACAVGLVFAVQYVHHEVPVDTKAATTAAAVSKPASGARDQGPAKLAAVQSQAGAVADALAGSSPPPAGGDSVPTFDV